LIFYKITKQLFHEDYSRGVCTALAVRSKYREQVDC